MIILEKKKHDFANFKLQIKRQQRKTPLNEKAYSRWGYRNGFPVQDDFSLNEIYDIIRSGELEAVRKLSLYFYRTNGEYKNNIDFLATLPLYDTIVIPVMSGKGSKTQIIKEFESACKFVENLDADWRIIGYKVVNYKKYKEDEDNER